MIGFRGGSGGLPPDDAALERSLPALRERYLPELAKRLDPARAATLPRGDVAREVKTGLVELLARDRIQLNLLDQRDLVTVCINGLLALRPVNQSEVLAAVRSVVVPLPLRRPEETEPPPAAPAPAVEPEPEPSPEPAAPAVTGGQPELAAVLRAVGITPGGPNPFAASPLGTTSLFPPDAEEPPEPEPEKPVETPAVRMASSNRATVDQAKDRIQPLLLTRIDTSAAAAMSRSELARDVGDIVHDLLVEQRLQLNLTERQELVERTLDDMLGLGPLEPLLVDEAVTDIMVNGPKQVYVERKGKLTLTDVQFRDNAHVMAIATRIVTAIGRRIDESSPLCDARLADGSRVNIIIPPLAIDGPSISIRKFSKKKITLDTMARQENISAAMCTVMKIAARCRLNILISGGTGSGKTTLLNAMSQLIDHTERVVTIEDAAELQLQQPHVVRLETRPPNLEGHGEITMRDLVKNALRMRPDRIILGEVRGSEAVDMLQAMNTGHDGSLGTIHANRPREALTRLENMFGMAGLNMPSKAVRTQVASALDLIVQVSRMRDGVRRVTHISEVVGMEGDVITMQDLFTFEFQGERPDGRLTGEFKSTGIRPHFLPKAAYFGLDKALLEAI
ncbi:CpaF family protein [Azospirillum sp. TSO22-1]|uniref:CpaF family protein n=1 Tax=Azospirillum sp. TSO22-1 TaxID=716789 RepID=UPI000D6469B6|nr:CpaF family protein [Azospirillum sp. TSO22-1]